MTPTRPRLLVVLAVVAAVVGWALTRLVDAYAGRSLPVPWTAPVVMALLALALVLWTRGTRARLARKPGTKPMEPIVAARSAALAMAGSRTGAAVGGFYLGVAVALSGSWEVPYVRELVLLALATVLGSVAVVAASLWLERVCRLPPDASGDRTP
jgi:uncharacterized membrane protein YoaK (UPF0700 family)